MAHTIIKNSSYSLKQIVMNFVYKLIQSPTVYPIKFYEKGKHIGKNRHSQLT